MRTPPPIVLAAVLAVAAVLATAGGALAHTDVTVLTETGQPVRGAKLTLPDGKEVATTDDRGRARLDLGPGTHTIVVVSGRTRVERRYTETPGVAGNVTWQVPAAPAAPGPWTGMFSLEPSAAAALFDLPTIKYGTLVTSPIIGTEEKIVESDDSPVGWSLGVDLALPITPNGAVTARVRWEQAETEASRSIPVGGSPVALVYIDRAPNGATAVGLGASGAEVNVDTTFRRLAAGGGYMHDMNHCFGWGDGPVRLKLGGGIAYFGSWLSHDAMQTSPQFAGVFSDAELDATTHIVGPSLDVGVELLRRRPVSLELSTYVVPGVAFGSGTARQDNRCNVCPAPQQAFTIKREEDRTDFGLVVGVGARLAYSVTERFQVGVTGGWEYANTLYNWNVPVSPVEQPARLERESTSTGFAGVFVRWTF